MIRVNWEFYSKLYMLNMGSVSFQCAPYKLGLNVWPLKSKNFYKILSLTTGVKLFSLIFVNHSEVEIVSYKNLSN